ncbi:hypothetical protein AB0O01_34625 [Streptomyces sp. NPDC093252]|uniref:hypothetical protein n=1 Tax=Streptomyces sp. NPDC093252 TaxID=3154980 RepID=UPI00343301ED
MSYDATPPRPQPPMPGFPPQQPPHPPKQPGRGRTNTVIICSALAVIATVVITGVAVSRGGGEAEARPTVTVTETVGAEDAPAPDEEPAADEAAPEDGVHALTDTVAYENDIEVSLAAFERQVSSDYAAPENTPYAKFTIKIVNNSDTRLDASMMTVSCAYGDEGKEGESIYDDGLDGLPDTSVLAGRSLSVPWGCELPKGETFLQVEVAPDWESDVAIFTGTVKK